MNFCPFGKNEKSDFYKLWQQHRQLKTMEMNEAYLVFSMGDIYISSNLNPLTKFTSSSRSTWLKDILSWNISQMVTKTNAINTRILMSYAMKCGILLWNRWKHNGILDNNMIRISQRRESHCRTNPGIRRKKEIQKSRTMRITVRDPSRKVNH